MPLTCNQRWNYVAATRYWRPLRALNLVWSTRTDLALPPPVPAAQLARMTRRVIPRAACAVVVIGCSHLPSQTVSPADGVHSLSSDHRLPTGVRLDPSGRSMPVGNMPLAALPSRDGRYLVLSLGGWREQGIEIVDRTRARVAQRLEQPGAFLGLAWSADAHALYASGGVADVVYEYRWHADAAEPATLSDSLVLGHADGKTRGSRYPAGLALAPNGRTLYIAENLSDSLAVVDIATRRVVQRVSVGPYPYAVAVAPDGRVFVSAWGATFVATFTPDSAGRLAAQHPIDVGRHPSALALNADGTRLFVASASTDRVAIVDTRARRVLRWLLDPPPGGVSEGSTPNALALSADGRRLYVAEADANAVAVFNLASRSSRSAAGTATDTLVGRIPTEWYPTAIVAMRDSLLVVNGKGRGTAPNLNGPSPDVPTARIDPHGYTLGQLNGTLLSLPIPHDDEMVALSKRVAHANGWDASPARRAASYPPFEHVVYIIKENRTYDQVLGDLPRGDGDTSLVFFPRRVSPNHHALAERFGIFDRFFVNAEVSNDGHPWSTAGYVTDFLEKTTPDDYRLARPEHDDPGDADDPAMGYLWDAAIRKGIALRDYGEYAENEPGTSASSTTTRTRSLIATLAPYTSSTYPAFDLAIPDQRRADAWLAEFHKYEHTGHMPALEILHLPSDHTAGARPGKPTPRAYMADNDLALGRIVDALSHSRFWATSVVFVLEDDAQDGADHVDSHRSVLLVISPWSRGGVLHRFVNTTDVLATIEQIFGLEPMSQFDEFASPLRDIWRGRPDLTPYAAITPSQPLTELNAAAGVGARRSEHIDLSRADRVDDDVFNRILWQAIKGPYAPYPSAHRLSVQEFVRWQ
jgi:YVTN family beta-propeller protein